MKIKNTFVAPFIESKAVHVLKCVGFSGIQQFSCALHVTLCYLVARRNEIHGNHNRLHLSQCLVCRLCSVCRYKKLTLRSLIYIILHLCRILSI